MSLYEEAKRNIAERDRCGICRKIGANIHPSDRDYEFHLFSLCSYHSGVRESKIRQKEMAQRKDDADRNETRGQEETQGKEETRGQEETRGKEETQAKLKEDAKKRDNIITTCTCGKKWNFDCASRGLFGNSMSLLDTSKLTNDPIKNRALLKDPSNFITHDSVVHMIRK